MLSIKNTPLSKIRTIFLEADKFKKIGTGFSKSLLEKKIIGGMFLQPSTRTRLGFEVAVSRMGGKLLGFCNINESRMLPAYGETPYDTLKVLEAYTDCIIYRHNVSLRDIPLNNFRVPIINAGDGNNEHPTQALLDLWILENKLTNIKGKVIGIYGPPNARSHRSFIFGLTKFQPKEIVFYFCSKEPPSDELLEYIKSHQIEYSFEEDLKSFLKKTHAINMLPVHIPDQSTSLDKNSVINTLPIQKHCINKELLSSCSIDTLIMHAGPRNQELDIDTDEMKNSLYFYSINNSIYMRQAILNFVLKGD